MATEKEILAKYEGQNPKKLKVFVYYTEKATGIENEMNLWEWLRIKRDRNRRDRFEFDRVVDLSEGVPTIETSDDKKPEEPEIVEDKFQCPLCGFVALNEGDLKLHKEAKHS